MILSIDVRPKVLTKKMHSTASCCRYQFGSALQLFTVFLLICLWNNNHNKLCEARPQTVEHEKITVDKKCGYEVSDKKVFCEYINIGMYLYMCIHNFINEYLFLLTYLPTNVKCVHHNKFKIRKWHKTKNKNLGFC